MGARPGSFPQRRGPVTISDRPLNAEERRQLREDREDLDAGRRANRRAVTSTRDRSRAGGDR